MVGFIAALFLIILAAVELGAFLIIPRLAKRDQEVWLKEVLKKNPSAYTFEEYVVQCLFEFVIFNCGLLVGLALGYVGVRAI